MHIIILIEDCQPKDSDSCLQASPGWYSSSRCSEETYWCTSYAKDMHRCCPESCDTGTLTEDQCHALLRSGTCTYPNSAQCPGNFHIKMIIRKYTIQNKKL